MSENSHNAKAWSPDDLRAALETLRKGGIIVYPTDTVWGIGCDATNPAAVKKVYALKERSDSKALITLVANEVMLERTVETVPDVAWQLLDVAIEPLTIIYDKGVGVCNELLGADGSLGVRLVGEGFARELCRRFGRPIVSTSANKAGQPTPMSYAEIDSSILEGADYVVEAERNAPAARHASGIIKLGNDGAVKVIR